MVDSETRDAGRDAKRHLTTGTRSYYMALEPCSVAGCTKRADVTVGSVHYHKVRRPTSDEERTQ